MFDGSKIKDHRSAPQLAELNLFELLQDVDSTVAMQALSKGLKFRIEYIFPLPEKIVTDPVWLRQLLISLCLNAIKLTNEGFVRIKVSCDAETEMLLFKVLYRGAGIKPMQNAGLPAKAMPTKDPVNTGSDTTEPNLSLSDSLLKEIGASISVESIIDVGSCISLVIPLGPLSPVKFVERTPASNSDNSLSPIVSTFQDTDPDLQELIHSFVARLPEMIASVKQSFDIENLEGFRQQVHKLKGTGGNFGFDEIFRHMQHMEFLVKEERVAEIPELLAQLDQLCVRVQKGLKSNIVVLEQHKNSN